MLAENGRAPTRGPSPKSSETPLDGVNLLSLSSYRQRMIRNRVMGIVFQNPHLGLKMHISSGGNIAERLLAAGWRHVGEIRRQAGGLLENTEVPRARMDEPPRNFSGGMQQRVQIAKALSNGPLILLLDELTTGLDVSVQAKVLDLICKLKQEMNVAILVVSHDLGVIRMLTRRTLVMKNGRVVEAGLTDQILEDPQHPYTQLMVSSML
jgi:putative phosphonate transport system ATP-binding protein